MTEIILHDQTRLAVRSFINDPTHAVGLLGPAGAGKSYLARHMADQLLGTHSNEALHVVSPESNSITIDQIRGLKQFLKLKKPGSGTIKRAVVIENAEVMGDEAQNALLKVLEEPPADTVFMLAIAGADSLRPTIYSRLQQIHVLPIGLDQAKAVLGDDITKAYHLSGGYVGLLSSLATDQNHELVAAVTKAKQLMSSSQFERLISIDCLAKDKDGLSSLFYALERVIGAGLVNSSGAQLERLVSSLRHVYQAKIDLNTNANTKLLLTDLFLNL